MFLAQQADSGSGTSSLILFALLAVVFYFFIIRPQRRRTQKQRELADSLQVGDRVRTVGGLRGTIEALDDDVAVLRVKEGSIEVERRAVAMRLDPTQPE